MNEIVYKGKTFDQKNIFSGSVHVAMSLKSSSLEVNTLSAEIRDPDKTFAEFSRNTPLSWRYNGSQQGLFYLQEVERLGPKRYRLYATSTIGILTEGLHYGGIYTGQSARDVIADICGTIPFSMQNKYASAQLYGWLPVAAPRDNLAQVLFAIGAWIKTDLDGVLRVEGLWDGLINDIGKNRLLSGAKVPETAKVTQVVVSEHQYIEQGDETTLFEGATTQGDVITFKEPMYSLSASGFSILDSGANYAKVSSGTGTLIGRPYVHNTREIVRNVEAAAEPNIKTVKNATLISLVNSVAVAERMANYYKCTEVIQSPVIYQGEIPGNRVSTWHPYDEIATTACLESADISFSNTLKADEKLLIGFVPPKYEKTQYYDHREFLTDSGSFLVPEGVTSLRLVLVGGGHSGENGAEGEPSILTAKTQNSLPASFSASSAGKGGAGGAGGNGGNIFEITFAVSPGARIQYSCGQGGTESALPTETTFGSYSSKSGAPLESGYTDQITGEVFGKKGQNGQNGGDGGGTGASGSDVNGNSGGNGLSSRTIQRTSSSTYGTAKATLGAAGGGGASATEPGKNARSGSAYESEVGTSMFQWTSLSPQSGGDGGNGGNGADGATYGCGGSGGHGGGGAGAIGSVNAGAPSNSSIYNNMRASYNGAWSKGGAGGAGGIGIKGCIIVYYSKPQKIISGPRKDKNGRVLLDRLNRLTIV